MPTRPPALVAGLTLVALVAAQGIPPSTYAAPSQAGVTAAPSAGPWFATSSLSAARQNYTAIRLDNGKVLVAGGLNNSGILASAELYDSTTGTWSPTGSMTGARYRHSATLLADGKVLVAGGFGGTTAGVPNAEVYDPATGSWTPTNNAMTTGRAYHTGTLLPNGQVLVTGGSNVTGILASAELQSQMRSSM